MEHVRSPFPGMDPYLESRWPDVHVKLIGFMGEAIQPLLPKDLRARGEERLLLESEDEDADAREYRSDVAVVETPASVRPTGSQAALAVATVDPVIIRRRGFAGRRSVVADHRCDDRKPCGDRD